mgnify:CR=1 FL=1|jgi:hypothetical protein
MEMKCRARPRYLGDECGQSFGTLEYLHVVLPGYHFRALDGVAIYIVHIHTIPIPPHYPDISIFELILQVKVGIMKRPGLIHLN